MLLFFLLGLALLPAIFSQDLSIPSSWPVRLQPHSDDISSRALANLIKARNTSLSRGQRIDISQAALDTVRPFFTKTGYLPGKLISIPAKMTANLW
jgi:hypothetical protein